MRKNLSTVVSIVLLTMLSGCAYLERAAHDLFDHSRVAGADDHGAIKAAEKCPGARPHPSSRLCR